MESVTFSAKDFNLKHTFLCGQCFRWDENDDGSFTGIALDRVVKIKASDKYITLFNANLQEFNEIWSNYFDFSRDYGVLKCNIAKDDIMRAAVDYGWGIRILHQNTWETIISFIISASNNIPRIKGIISRLCELYGNKIEAFGNTYYTFPTPQALKGATESDLAPIRSGFRAKYIVDAVNAVFDGRLNLNEFPNMSTQEIKQRLLGINGIGNKVADCILLFGCGRFDVFPVDTWIKKAMNSLYPDECARCRDVRTAGEEYFGENCGLAQQYLFYYARENKLNFGEEPKT